MNTQKNLFLFIISSFLSASSFGQKVKSDSLLTIPLVVGSAGFNVFSADLAKDYKSGFEIGGSFLVKTESKWIYGIEALYLFSDRVNQNTLENATTSEGGLLGADGLYADIRVTMRGMKAPIFKAGRIISLPFKRASINSGVYGTLGAGFFQHSFHFEDITRSAPLVHGDYAKGYDRLTNGLLITEEIGYLYLDKQRKINFFIACELSQAFTKNRRSYDFATQSTINSARLDLLNGLKIGWIFPIYKKLPADYYYY